MGLNVNQDEDFFEKSGLVNAASLYTLTGNKYDKMLAAEYIVDELTPGSLTRIFLQLLMSIRKDA